MEKPRGKGDKEKGTIQIVALISKEEGTVRDRRRRGGGQDITKGRQSFQRGPGLRLIGQNLSSAERSKSRKSPKYPVRIRSSEKRPF